MNNVFQTPEEFINYYTVALKNELQTYDIQINKLGFIGFLLNILGHTNFDAKEYYDSLFKESSIATSQHSENLYLHASIYGYLPTFAKPSYAEGVVNFDFRLLPKITGNINKREVILGSETTNVKFAAEGYNFTTDTIYKFIETHKDYSATVLTNQGRTIQIPSATMNLSAGLEQFYQYETQTISLKTPNYDFGTYYPFIVEIDDGFISDIEVFVSNQNENLKQYDIKYVKYFEEGFSKTVFLRKLTSRKYIIEFGSGVRGAYIPLSDITINLKVTKGSSGNLSRSSNIKPESGVPLVLINYYNDGTTDSISYDAAQLINFDFNYSKDGENPLDGDDLRNDILAYIQSRDNLVSERDFYNIAEKYITDFKFLFKKGNVFDNIFYLCRTIRDKYQSVCKTDNLTIRKIDTSVQVSNFNFNISDEPGNVEIGDYVYKIVGSDNFNYTTVSEPLIVPVAENGTSINLSWDEFDGVQRYIIYKKQQSETDYKLFFETNETQVIDSGINFNTCAKEFESNLVFMPTFVNDGIVMVSPFLYKYSKFMNWYDGYLFYNSFPVHFKEFKYYISSYDAPVIYFFIEYNHVNRETVVSLKSHQDIGEYNFTISITQKGIYDQQLNKTIDILSNKPIFTYTHTDNDGIFWDKFQITLTAYNNNSLKIFTAATEDITQCYNIADQLRLLNYNNINYVLDPETGEPTTEVLSTSKHVLNIPMIDKNKYEEDPKYYLDKINSLIVGQNVPGNRMISDNVQFRFLKTTGIDSFYTKTFLSQEYDEDYILPIKMSVDIKVDKDVIIKNKIDLSDTKYEILLELVEFLQKTHTTTDIKFYNSQIVDLIHTDRFFIKSVQVTIKDSQDKIIPNGLEILETKAALDKIKYNKLKVISYTPWYWYWDIDNIDIKITF